MATDYNARSLAKDLLAYFTTNPNAFEVMIFKRNKVIQVKRVSVENHNFIKKFILFYHK